MSAAKIRENACGLDLPVLVKQIKGDLRIKYPLRVFFDRKNTPQAMATRSENGKIGEIHLPTCQTIKRKMPGLSERGRKAKVISQIAEESCHLKEHETDHNKAVVSCTLREMRKYIPKRDMKIPYIRQKVAALKSSDTIIGAKELE